MGVAILEECFYDYQVVDVVKILANAFGRDVWVHATNDEITSSPNSYLICNVTGKDELAIIPGDFNLEALISNAKRSY